MEFQTRTKGQRELYKLLRLASCALYLDPDCQSPLIAKASAAGPAHASSAVGGAMRELIARSSRNENDPTGPGTARGGLRAESYLVAPLTLEVTPSCQARSSSAFLTDFCIYFVSNVTRCTHFSFPRHLLHPLDLSGWPGPGARLPQRAAPGPAPPCAQAQRLLAAPFDRGSTPRPIQGSPHGDLDLRRRRRPGDDWWLKSVYRYGSRGIADWLPDSFPSHFFIPLTYHVG